MGAVADMVSSKPVSPAAEPVQGLRTQHIIMVVDDSLTVRRVTQRLLAREGYQVVLAKDGVDALEQLQAITPDVMLVDIEMPRMDGFDLTRNVRGDERTRHIPIIMITSRTATKHRNYAMELGVNEYLGKPYQEDDLLKSIAGFINKTAAVN
jgi:chemosensory pili system protein ChpA (sensor histidine kinase/response regulator)